MRRTITVALVTVGLLLTATPSVARVGAPPRFNRTAVLDTSQVVDTRAEYGEVICPAGASPDNDPQGLCTVDRHPASEER